MVEIEDRVNIEIEIYRIEIFLKISKSIFIESKLYRKYRKLCYKTIKKNYDSIFFETKLNRCYFDKYHFYSIISISYS